MSNRIGIGFARKTEGYPWFFMPFRQAYVFEAFCKLKTHKHNVSMQIHSNARPIKHRQIGVLGGMGPLATVDFLHKVVCSTQADVDQDHVPMVVGFCSKTPRPGERTLGPRAVATG
jgi:hypothetical protein